MSEALRLYLRELRIKRGITQEKAADAIDWSSRSFNEWETGKNDDIKSRFLIRLVLLLDASWEDVAHLEVNNVTAQEAIDLANRITSPRSAINTDAQVEQLIGQLLEDEALRNAFLIFWSGWKARGLS